MSMPAPLLPLCTHLVYSNAYRTTSAERRAIEEAKLADPDETYENIRRAAEVHRLVRQHAKKTIKPGMSLTECVESIEDGVRALVEGDGKDCGIGFPTGINRNEIAAHYSPNAGDTVGKYIVYSFILVKLMIDSARIWGRCQDRYWCACQRTDM